jgi:hypothetical protein
MNSGRTDLEKGKERSVRLRATSPAYSFALSPVETLFGRASEARFDELRANGLKKKKRKANASEHGTELRFVPWRYWLALHFNAGTQLVPCNSRAS